MYPTANSLGYGGTGQVSQEGLDRMVDDLQKQWDTSTRQAMYSLMCYRIEKRSKFSRRREFRDDQNVDYINERNRRFNAKAARYYNKYSAEIRQNLERGTAL